MAMQQSLITDHFIKMAEGQRPVKKNGVILIPQVGHGSGVAELTIVSPSEDAVNQARSDLKRGVDNSNVYEEALRNDAKRKKLSQSHTGQKKGSGKKAEKTKKKKKSTTKKKKKKTSKKKTAGGKKKKKNTKAKKK